MEHYEKLVKLRDVFFKVKKIKDVGIRQYDNQAIETLEKKFEAFVEKNCNDSYKWIVENDANSVFYIALTYPGVTVKEFYVSKKEPGI